MSMNFKEVGMAIAFGLVVGFFGSSLWDYLQEPEVQVSSRTGLPVKMITTDGQAIQLAAGDKLPERYNLVLVK